MNLLKNITNVLDLIDQIHRYILHQGLNKILDKINYLKMYYKGIITDINQIKDLCEICIQSNIKLYK